MSSEQLLVGFNENLVRKDTTPPPSTFDRISVDSLLTDGALSSQKILNLEANKITVIGGKISDGVISGADAWNAKVDSGDLGAMAFEDLVEASKLGTTVVEGGYLKTILIDAQYIQAGTLVGRTVKAKGSGTGVDVWLDSSDGSVKFYNGASLVAYIFSDTNGHITIDSDNHIYISADGSGDDIYFVAGDDFAVSSRSISIDCSTDIYHICDNHYVVYNDDGDNSDCHWVSDTTERMQLQQDGDLIVDGNLSANNFDFAEYFESKSGEKIPNGTTVVLDGEKIRPALPGETPIGVISATAGVALNGGGSEAGNSWGQKYLRDDFGEKIYEEVERWSKYVTEEVVKENGKKGKRRKRLKGFTAETPPPKGAKVKIVKRQKLNPLWDPKKTFIPRKKRPEWNIVGLLGRVRIRVGQPVSPTWIKLRTISDVSEEWLIR